MMMDMSRDEIIKVLRHCGNALKFQDCNDCLLHNAGIEDCSGALMLAAANMLEFDGESLIEKVAQ